MWFVSYISLAWGVRVPCFSPPSINSQRNTDIMKKKQNPGFNRKRPAKSDNEKETANVEKPTINIDSLDEEDQGFGGWLKSPDGLDTMKLFVVANSIVMLTTLVYPQLQTVFSIIYDMVYGEDSFY